MPISIDLSGKSALVTGAARGIGKAIAGALAEAGAAVAVSDLDAAEADAVAKAVQESTGSVAVGIALDVADPASISTGIAHAGDAIGKPDILVNNAGLYQGTPLLDTSPATWQLMLDVMLTGPLLLAQAVVPHMQQQKWGRIVNMGSQVSAVSFGEDIAYSAAKAGLAGMTRSMAAELAEHQICVNTICPGNVDTRLMHQTAAAIEERDGLEPGQFMSERDASIPLGRLGVPLDVARLVVFLASDLAAYITAQSIHVNGGLYQT